MKKLLSIFVMGLMLISLVSVAFAAQTNVADDQITSTDMDEEDRGRPGNAGRQDNNELDYEENEEDENDDYEVDDEEKETKNQIKEKVLAKIGNKDILSEVEVTTDAEGKFQAKMSNGNNKEIKVMPAQASERAIEALKLHNCREEDGCTIELKEVGEGNETKAMYQVKTQKEAKLFGFMKVKMNVEANIDAETNEVLKTKKAWWAFLASEEDVEETEEVADEIVENETEETEDVDEIETNTTETEDFDENQTEDDSNNETILNATSPNTQNPSISNDALAR